MAKRKRNTRPQAMSIQQEQGPALAPPLNIAIDRLVCRTASYREVEVQQRPTPPEQGAQLAIELKFDVRVSLFDQAAELYMGVEVRPDPSHVPIEIQVGYSLFFRRPPELTEDAIKRFASTSGLIIIYPYVRQMVSDLSARGLFGPVWLDPLGAQTLLRPSAHHAGL